MSIWRRIVGGGDDSIERARRPSTAATDIDTEPRQGIDWLGRTPGPEAPLLYRLLLRLARLFLFGLCRLRLRVDGRDRLLPATTPAELLGDAWSGSPEPGSREELRVARAMTAALRDRLAVAVSASYPQTVGPPGATRRWPWLTRLLR